MMDYYTVTQVAEIISKKRKTTAHAVRKVCERNGFGIKVNARLRLIPAGELQAIRSVISATKYRSRVSRKSNRESCQC